MGNKELAEFLLSPRGPFWNLRSCWDLSHILIQRTFSNHLGLILQNRPWKILLQRVEQTDWVLKFHNWKTWIQAKSGISKALFGPCTWNCVSCSLVLPWERFESCFLLPQAGEQLVEAGCWPCGRMLLSSQGFLGSKMAFSSFSPLSLPCLSLSPASSSFLDRSASWSWGSVTILVGRYLSGKMFPRDIFTKPSSVWSCLMVSLQPLDCDWDQLWIALSLNPAPSSLCSILFILHRGHISFVQYFIQKLYFPEFKKLKRLLAQNKHIWFT